MMVFLTEEHAPWLVHHDHVFPWGGAKGPSNMGPPGLGPPVAKAAVNVERDDSDHEAPALPEQGRNDEFRVKLLSSRAFVPKRGTSQSAGLDLFACESVLVRQAGRALVGTGVSSALPTGTYGRIVPKSGLAVGRVAFV